MKKIEQEHPDEKLDIRFFINLTAGTKIITAAASVAAIGINARMCYVVEDKYLKEGREKYLVFEPQSTFNFDDMPTSRKRKIWAILQYLSDNKEHTRSEVWNNNEYNILIGRDRMSPQTGSYNVNDLIDKGLIIEMDPTKKRNSPIKIADLGQTVLGYIRLREKDMLSKTQSRDNIKGTEGLPMASSSKRN